VPGRGLFQGLGIGLPKLIGSPMAPGVPLGGVVQVQILQGFGFLGGLGSKGSREQGLFLVHCGVETPGLLRLASAGAVPVMQIKESIIGNASSFFMIVNKTKRCLKRGSPFFI